MQMLGVFAEFETANRRERQKEGIAKAKGVYRGRSLQAPRNGQEATEIAKKLGIGRASVYRILNERGKR